MSTLIGNSSILLLQSSSMFSVHLARGMRERTVKMFSITLLALPERCSSMSPMNLSVTGTSVWLDSPSSIIRAQQFIMIDSDTSYAFQKFCELVKATLSNLASNLNDADLERYFQLKGTF